MSLKDKDLKQIAYLAKINIDKSKSCRPRTGPNIVRVVETTILLIAEAETISLNMT